MGRIGFQHKDPSEVSVFAKHASVASLQGTGNAERVRLPIQGRLFLTIRLMVWCALSGQDIDVQYVPVDGKILLDLIEADFAPIVSADIECGSAERRKAGS